MSEYLYRAGADIIRVRDEYVLSPGSGRVVARPWRRAAAESMAARLRSAIDPPLEACVMRGGFWGRHIVVVQRSASRPWANHHSPSNDASHHQED